MNDRFNLEINEKEKEKEKEMFNLRFDWNYTTTNYTLINNKENAGEESFREDVYKWIQFNEKITKKLNKDQINS